MTNVVGKGAGDADKGPLAGLLSYFFYIFCFSKCGLCGAGVGKVQGHIDGGVFKNSMVVGRARNRMCGERVSWGLGAVDWQGGAARGGGGGGHWQGFIF